MQEPDFMLKYSVLMCFIVFIAIVVVQSLNSPYEIQPFVCVIFILNSLSFQQGRNHLLAAEWGCVCDFIPHFGNHVVQETVGALQSDQRG